MINPKYDQNNYLKHLAIPVITDNQKINQLFGSYLLRVKWWHTDKSQLNQVGTLRVHIDTPFGLLKPQDYRLDINNHKNIYVQFLTLPNPEYQYQIEVIHPEKITRSMLEIWEYIPPQSFTNTSNMPFYPEEAGSNPDMQALIQATADNAVAIGGLSTTIAGQPSAIADALEGDDVNVLDPVLFTLGTTPTLISAASDNNKGLLISNQGNTKVKLWVSESALSPATGYNSGGYIFDMTGKGSYEMPEPFYKSNVYAVSQNANGLVSVTKSVRV